jgi:hypothetical protein
MFSKIKSTLNENAITVLKQKLKINEPSTFRSTAKSVPLVILIFGCVTKQKYADQIRSIENTWGKTAQDLKVPYFYFLGQRSSEFSDSSKFIYLPNIKDDYSSASYKQYLGLKWVCEHYNPNYVFICGTDTFINVNKLNDLLQNKEFKLKYSENLYIGGHGDTRTIANVCDDNNKCHNMSVHFHSGGSGIIISNNVLFSMYDYYDTFQSNWISFCNEHNNEYLKDACDVSISFLLQCFNVTSYEINGFYYCNFNGVPCCKNKIKKENIITCHLMTTYDNMYMHRFINKFIVIPGQPMIVGNSNGKRISSLHKPFKRRKAVVNTLNTNTNNNNSQKDNPGKHNITTQPRQKPQRKQFRLTRDNKDTSNISNDIPSYENVTQNRVKKTVKPTQTKNNQIKRASNLPKQPKRK